ncbi:MAG: DUF2442 domain-containing protein [Caldilineaceae bacterium]
MEQLGPLVRVQAVELLDGFKVRVTFKNGVQKEINLDPYLRGPIFEPIRSNRELFHNVKVIGSTIGWDNGASIDPDVLYYNLKPAWMDKEDSEFAPSPVIIKREPVAEVG